MAKKSHMVGPVEVPAFAAVRGRSKSVEVREIAAARRPARSRRKIAYGVIRAGMRARTPVHGPAS